MPTDAIAVAPAATFQMFAVRSGQGALRTAITTARSRTASSSNDHTRYATSSGRTVTGSTRTAAMGESTKGRLPSRSGAISWSCSRVCSVSLYSSPA